MFSLASVRYRNVLTVHGGPIERVDVSEFPVCGRRMFQANARLVPGLTPPRGVSIYSDADGTGTHAVASTARHIAVSEALERWAFYAVSQSEHAADFGFDVDPSSNGMAAFPGVFRRAGRRKAMLEAIERFCLIAWWEGMADGHLVSTDWPGVSAVAIDGPFGGVTTIAFARVDFGGYAYGHAAEESIGAASERAVVELARHEFVLRSWQLGRRLDKQVPPSNPFERRALFFASEEGHELFQARLERRPHSSMSLPRVACDCEIPGPWANYASVWRFALCPPSDGFLHQNEQYFFW